MIKRIIFLACLVIVTLFISCENDSTATTEISGLYNIVKAERNGKETQTLKDGVFDFSSENILKTNIFGQELSLNYVEKKGGKINVSGLQEFTLIRMPNMGDTLVYRTKIRKMRMKFYMVKQEVAKEENK